VIFSELREIQRQFGYLPADQLKALAKKIDVPLYRLHGVASFYPHFHLTPPPKANVRVCQDMSCHLRGARALRTELEESFRHSAITEAKIGGVSCLGRCNEAPAVAINEQIYTGLSEHQITAMVGDVLAGGALPEISQVHRRVACASDPYSEGEHYQTIQRLIESRDWAAAFETLKASGLRGLGGAGFPTESKWQLVRQAAGPEKFIVCNADESEPGTGLS
jgi:NADH:ubiquinone oxidoreductase subunit E